MSQFDGDVKVFVDENGLDIRYHSNGQPSMEQGKANVVLLTLFTPKGWHGNHFVKRTREYLGSDFLLHLKDPVTVSSLNDLRSVVEAALKRVGFTQVTAEITNPESHVRNIKINIVDSVGTVYTYFIDKLGVTEG